MPDQPPEGSQPTEGSQGAQQAGADDRAALLAELAAEVGELGAEPAPIMRPVSRAPKKPAPAPTPKPAPAPAPEPGDDGEPDADAEPDATEIDDPDDAPEIDADEAEDDALDPDDEPADEPDADPELRKRHEALRRTDERLRLRREQERAQLDRERRQHAAEVQRHQADQQELGRFRQLAARAKYDPASLLEAAGYTADDMEYAAQQIYARSKKAASDANYRAAAERAQREREAADKATAAERRVAEIEAKLEAKERQAAEDAALDQHFRGYMAKVTDATPITKQLIAKAPKMARQALTQTAFEIAQKLGRMPKASELHAAHERKEQRWLAARGIALPGAQPAADPVAPAGKTAPAPTTRSAPKPAKGAPAKPAPAASASDTIPSTDDLLREIREGKHLEA